MKKAAQAGSLDCLHSCRLEAQTTRPVTVRVHGLDVGGIDDIEHGTHGNAPPRYLLAIIAYCAAGVKAYVAIYPNNYSVIA